MGSAAVAAKSPSILHHLLALDATMSSYPHAFLEPFLRPAFFLLFLNTRLTSAFNFLSTLPCTPPCFPFPFTFLPAHPPGAPPRSRAHRPRQTGLSPRPSPLQPQHVCRRPGG
ncbi:hypothetical protein SLE2022_226900 [Rubroshorea leprosula]